MQPILLSFAVLALVGGSLAVKPFILERCSGAKPGIPVDIVAQRGAALFYSNDYRRRHGALPLTVDPTLEAEAQKQADYMASTGTIVGGWVNGENIARIPCDDATQQKYPTEATIPGAVFRWYGQMIPFRCPNPARSLASFAGIVWKATEKVGFGAAVRSDGFIFVVAKYSPPFSGDPAAKMQNVQCEEVA